jgi:hypothetical protein
MNSQMKKMIFAAQHCQAQKIQARLTGETLEASEPIKSTSAETGTSTGNNGTVAVVAQDVVESIATTTTMAVDNDVHLA